MKQPKGTQVKKEIVFQLSEAEYAEKAREMAALDKEIARINLEFEEVKEVFKARIKDREAQRLNISHVVNDKQEVRLVECTMVEDFEEKRISWWFEGEQVEERAMTEQELQMRLEMKSPRASKRQAVQSDADAGRLEDEGDVRSVIKSETGRRTKLSAVDGSH